MERLSLREWLIEEAFEYAVKRYVEDIELDVEWLEEELDWIVFGDDKMLHYA